MFLHTVYHEFIINEGYEFSCAPQGQARMDQIFCVPHRYVNFLYDLKGRIGLTEKDKLNGYIFSSVHVQFSKAFEYLIFGRIVDVKDPDWILTNVLIPALMYNTEPNIYGFDIMNCFKYMTHINKNGLIVEDNLTGSEFGHYNGDKWLTYASQFLPSSIHLSKSIEPADETEIFRFYRQDELTKSETLYAMTSNASLLKIIEMR